MAFFEKLGDLAKNVGEKTGDALETGKLQLKIRGEKSNIEENYKKIGEYIYKKYEEGLFNDEGISQYFDAIKTSNDNINKLENEIADIKNDTDNESVNNTVVDSVAKDIGSVCPKCGQALEKGSKFCSACGASL